MPFIKTKVISINTFSDGDATHEPKAPGYSKVEPPDVYLEKIATLWMNHRGESVTGVRYVLNRLPDGYTLWAKRRGNQAVDKYLFGHPLHRYFDSPNKFFPHFLHLMENGTNDGCSCVVCASKGGKIPALGAHGLPKVPLIVSKPRGRPRINEGPPPLDSEGTPDIYRMLINKLEQNGTINVPIEEPMSLDWRVENKHLVEMLDRTANQPSWIPRLGELVLFVRDIDNPTWEAGVVTQVAQEELQIEDLVKPLEKIYQVNYSGFRIEPISDPNSKIKRLSRQYKYVPLHHIKPFAFHDEVLQGPGQTKIHETIQNAKTLSSSLTLIGKYRFKGTWPSSEIFCKGIYLGAELVVVGDTVRLLPKLSTASVTDILKITAIKLRLSNLDKASRDDQSNGHPYNCNVVIVGKAYTTDIKKAGPNSQPVRSSFGLIPAEIHDYSKWYPLHPAAQSMEIPFMHILSRCYASKAMSLWFSSSESDASNVAIQSTGLSSGLQGVLQARNYGRHHDKRLLSEGRNWLWTDTRAEALDVDSINGIETAKYDESREAKRWVKYVKELDGVADPEDKAALIRAAEKSRKSFGGSAGQSSFVKSALAPISGSTSDEDDNDDDDDDDDDERASKRSRSAVPERREGSDNNDRLREDTNQVMEDFIEGKGFPVNKGKEVVTIADDSNDEQEGEEESDVDEDDVEMLDKFQSR